MAGDWMKFEKTTLEKPEVFEIADRLGIDPDAVIGKLLRVWNWFDDHSKNGKSPVTVRALLNRYTGVTGFTEAMQSVGWLVVEDDQLCIPNFDRHNGSPAKTRALGKIRQENHRCNANSNASSVTESVTTPLPEKRREENKREEPIQPPAGEELALVPEYESKPKHPIPE